MERLAVLHVLVSAKKWNQKEKSKYFPFTVIMYHCTQHYFQAMTLSIEAFS